MCRSSLATPGLVYLQLIHVAKFLASRGGKIRALSQVLLGRDNSPEDENKCNGR